MNDNSKQIAVLKKKFRRVQKELNSHLDNFSCGLSLARYISPEVSELMNKWNGILDELKALGGHIKDEWYYSDSGMMRVSKEPSKLELAVNRVKNTSTS